MSRTSTLTAEQSKALFDVLTHWETYKEIEDFKFPGAILRYGPPFQDDVSVPQSPILQSLLSKFILHLPGLRDITPVFWKGRVEDLIQDLAEADLSESYDKGFLGIRKTLATAIAALIEYPSRGFLAGLPQVGVDPKKPYDTSSPDDVLQSWKDAMQGIVYGDLIDKTMEKVAETDQLSDHETLLQAVHEFIVVNVASIMHYTIVLSPEGPTLIRMLDSVHKLIPYMLIRQTLKIGNVATMISGMVRVILAKVSVGSVTNFLGLSKGAAEGMNLLQSIISQVLWWDKRELKKRADKIERESDAPPKDVAEELKKYLEAPRQVHEECRRASQSKQISIVAAILARAEITTQLTEAQHEHALKYLSLHLSVRDRTEIVRVLCHRNPDVLTAAIKEAVDTYTPIIRQVHQAVNLADGFYDLEQFLTDTIRTSKPTSASAPPPSVEDFVDLLHRHTFAVHKFLHQLLKNSPELRSAYQSWLHTVVAHFRVDRPAPPSPAVIPAELDAGGAPQVMAAAFAEIEDESLRATIAAELDAHAEYITALHAASAARIAAVVNRTRDTPFGPGAYLARWQQLMDATRVTPATAKGQVRFGSDRSVKEEGRKDVDGQKSGFAVDDDRTSAGGASGKERKDAMPVMPRSEVTLRVLGPKFRAVLAGVGAD